MYWCVVYNNNTLVLSRATVDGKDVILTEQHEIKLFNN